MIGVRQFLAGHYLTLFGISRYGRTYLKRACEKFFLMPSERVFNLAKASANFAFFTKSSKLSTFIFAIFRAILACFFLTFRKERTLKEIFLSFLDLDYTIHIDSDFSLNIQNLLFFLSIREFAFGLKSLLKQALLET
jgi:hypothetical protein